MPRFLRRLRRRWAERQNTSSNARQKAVPQQDVLQRPSIGNRDKTLPPIPTDQLDKGRSDGLTAGLERLNVSDRLQEQQISRSTVDKSTDFVNSEPTLREDQLSTPTSTGEKQHKHTAPNHPARGKHHPYSVRSEIKDAVDGLPQSQDGSILLPDQHPVEKHTTVDERIAPAVTHETIVRDTHHVRQEYITRDIHHDHYVHRILPIKDVEVLPARHFIPTDSGYLEVPEHEVPAHTAATQAAMVGLSSDDQHLTGQHGVVHRKPVGADGPFLSHAKASTRAGAAPKYQL